MAGEPITAAGDGEVGIAGGWVDDVSAQLISIFLTGHMYNSRNLPREPVDVFLVLTQPTAVVLCNDSRDSQKVPVVEVVIIVVSVPEVDVDVVGSRFADDAAPGCLVRWCGCA